MMFTEQQDDNSKYNPESYKSDYRKKENNGPSNTRYTFQAPEPTLEPPAIITLNLAMLQKLMGLSSSQNSKNKQILFKYIEVCAMVIETQPLIVKDQTQMMTINSDIIIEAELKGEYAVIYIQKTREGALKLKSIRKALPKQMQLHNLVVQASQSNFLLNQPQKSTINNNERENEKKRMQFEKSAQISQTIKDKLVLWLTNQGQFTIEDICDQFKQIDVNSLNKFIELCLMQGAMANLENKFVWMG